MLNKNQAIEKMNRMGKARKPFLFVIDFLGDNSLIFQPDEINDSEILFSIASYTNADKSKFRQTNPELNFSKFPISFQSYLDSFEKVKKQLDFGNTYLVNLTQPTPISLSIGTKEIFYRSKAPYKLWLKDQFVVFSPEIFVQIAKDSIASFPMKGTIDAAIPDAERIILNDVKEKAEHNTIVDLIRNDLSMLASNVRVERFRYIERVKTNQKELLQVSSKIVGDLGSDFFDELGSRFFQLLPAGSISGAPKTKTLEVIQEAENYNRGFYTGVFGYFDGQNMDSAVMIRFIDEQNGTLVFKSGGGITIFSKAESEYQELIDKVYVPIY